MRCDRRGLACLAVAMATACGAHAAPEHVPGRILVKLAPAAAAGDAASVASALGARVLASHAFIGVHVLEFSSPAVEEAVAFAAALPQVEYAEPDYVVRAEVLPDDPQFPILWGLRNTGQTGGLPGADIQAASAWNLYRGDSDLRVGVIDTGIDYTHPDLAANIWTNPGEIAGNHIDDDGNGYTDDVHGFDFVNGDGDPMDDQGHGTHVAGTIAAVGDNGLGVAGVGWRCALVPIKFLDHSGLGSVSGAIASLEYALRIGVALTSNSWGGGGESQALADAIEAAGQADQLFVAAAGNARADNDSTAFYPASYASPYVVAVAATTADDSLAWFSNSGAASVDLGAPGVAIYSCMPGGGYQLLSGTSMATPHVAGVAALLRGFAPQLDNVQVKDRILASTVPVPALAGRCVTGGRLNAFLALAVPDSIAPGSVLDLAVVEAASTRLRLAWTATGDDGDTGRAASYDIRYATSPIDATNFGAATAVPRPPDPEFSGVTDSLWVSGLDFDTTYHFALRALDEWDRPGALSNVAAGTTLGAPRIAVDPESIAVTLVAPATAVRTLRLTNAGAGTLDYEIAVPELVPVATPKALEPHQALSLPKGAPDPRTGVPVVAGRGGPDPFGYRWVDSDEAGGPPFEWLDITAAGTPIPLVRDDQTIQGIPLGFAFPFYGRTFTSINVTSNGFQSFSATGNLYLNQPLPNRGPSVPADLVAPFWDDLDFSAPGARAFAWSDGARCVIAYHDVPHFEGEETYTFETVLAADGDIQFRYLSMGEPSSSATAGIQDATRTVGLQVAFNTYYVHDSLLVRISPLPQWVSLASPEAGSVPAGAAHDVWLALDPLGLATGAYRANVHIASNDPQVPSLVVPITLSVTAVSGVEEVPPAAGLDLLGRNPFHGALPLCFRLPAPAEVDVSIYDVRGLRVRSLVAGMRPHGAYRLDWDGHDDRGLRCASGVYLVELRSGGSRVQRKVTLLR